MNLPVLGAAGAIGVAPAPDQPAVPGFAHLVTALLAGSDVISEEVAQSANQPPTPRQEGIPNGPAPDEDAPVEIGHDAPWPALMVHPSLVADALLRHLEQVGTFGLADETPLGESPPIEPAALARPMAPTAFAIGAVPLVPVPAPANPDVPAVSPLGLSLAVAPPPQPSTDPADELEPATPEPDGAPGGQSPAMPPAAVAPPPGGPPITTPVAPAGPSTDLSIDPAGRERGGLAGLTSYRTQGSEVPRVAADRPADSGIEIEPDQEPRSTVRSENHGEATAIPTDRTQKDAEVARIGTRPAEALSTAARRVEEAVRQLEAAPPPSSVTMVIEELDLRLTVAIRPDGVHLSAPGPEAPMLIRSLEEALDARGFDLSGRQRGRKDREQPEAPAIPSAPRPTTRPATGLRM